MELESIEQQIIDLYDGLVFWKNRDFQYLGCNHHFLDASGLELNHHIVGKIDTDMPWKKYAFDYVEDDKKVMDGEKVDHIERFKTHEGIKMKVHVRKYPLYEHDEVVGVVGFARFLSLVKPEDECLTNCSIVSNTRIHVDKDDVRSHFFGLTLREAQCLFYFIRGWSAKAVADKLGLSPRTIETFLIKIKLKFNVDTKGELVSTAIKSGFVDILPEGIEDF